MDAVSSAACAGSAGAALAHRYVVLNKPAGCVTARQTNNGRALPTVYDVLTAAGFATDLGHAGRLDTDTEGLLLFTDDGLLLQAMTNHYPARKLISLLSNDPNFYELPAQLMKLCLQDVIFFAESMITNYQTSIAIVQHSQQQVETQMYLK